MVGQRRVAWAETIGPPFAQADVAVVNVHPMNQREPVSSLLVDPRKPVPEVLDALDRVEAGVDLR